MNPNERLRRISARLAISVFGIIFYSAMAIAGQALNGLSHNGLPINGMPLNGMTLNGLSSIRLPSNTVIDLETLKYVATCALQEGDELIVEVDGVMHTLPGNLGLAPEWKNGPLSESGERWITACLLSLTNYYGVHLPVSLRGGHSALEPMAGEAIAYTVEEGAFYGNLFSETPYTVSCIGRNGPDTGSSPDLKNRVCATDVNGEKTVCGFIAAGQCQAVCGEAENGQGYTDCPVTGEGQGRIDEVITVFLRKQGDDPH